jgi:YgiT-type zinc finger domain-containing protein
MVQAKTLFCVRCGTTMVADHLSQYFVITYNDEVVICEGVPIHHCPHCGEIYFSAHVAETLEKIRRGEIPYTGKKTLKVPVYLMESALAAA